MHGLTAGGELRGSFLCSFLLLRIQRESPTLVDKQGVLVVKAEPGVDLTNNITQQERKRYGSETE
jgi:hypothetical protein